MNFEGAIQSLECPSLLSCGKFDFNQTLITFHISGIQSDGAIGVINRLIRSLQISRVDKSELLVWLRLIRICLDRVFQYVDRLWEIVLLNQQTGHARGEL